MLRITLQCLFRLSDLQPYTPKPLASIPVSEGRSRTDINIALGIPLSIERAEALVDEFCAEYPVASIIEFRIYKTQQELYGPQITREAAGTILGSFHPGQVRSLYATSNFSPDEEFTTSPRLDHGCPLGARRHASVARDRPYYPCQYGSSPPMITPSSSSQWS